MNLRIWNAILILFLGSPAAAVQRGSPISEEMVLAEPRTQNSFRSGSYGNKRFSRLMAP